MSYSSRVMTDNDWKKLTHFKPSEFHHPEKMGWEFMILLDALRAKCGFSIQPYSDYRSPEHNTEVGGAKDSAHMLTPCEAVDFTPKNSHERFVIVKNAIALGFVRIGVYKKDESMHLDKAEDTNPAQVMWNVV